jgi:outer membrane receptor for ferrienterochelin and colicin
MVGAIILFTMRLVCFFLLLGPYLMAQTTRISGYLYAAASGEALVGASIYLPAQKQGVLSDNYGHYNVQVNASGTVRIQVSYVGFEPIDTLLDGQDQLEIDFYLRSKSLEEVVIVSKAGNLQANIAQIPVERLKAVPMLLGQPDLIKALSILPGVSSGVEGTTGLYIRGGTPDQNLILLDGATVYNASHLFGFQSIFDPNAIKDIKLIKGGFPARYGGRLSSIIDITMKEGNNRERHGEFSLGLINSGVMLEGPIKNGRSSYMVSARAAYLGLLLLPTALGWKKEDDRTFNTLLSYDVNLKFNHQFKNKDKIFASFYLGNDNFLTRFRYDSAFYRTDLGWGNKTGSLRYIRNLGTKVYSQSIATYTAYQSGESSTQDYINSGIKAEFIRQSRVRDFTFKQLFTLPLNAGSRLLLGADASLQYFKPTSFSLLSNEFSLDSVKTVGRSFQVFTAAGFADWEWRILPWLNVNSGLRWSYFGQGQTRAFWEPRLNVEARSKAFVFNLAYARTAQFIHLLANNSLGLFSDLWIPSTDAIKPQTAQQYSGGIIWRRPAGHWEVGLEAFYKTLQNQIDYRQGIDFFALKNQDWQNTIEGGGRGLARGLETMIKYDHPHVNAFVAYTLSWNERQFDKINNGQWYPFRYDRRHNLNLNALMKLSTRWNLSMNWIYQTGSWISLRSVVYEGYRNNLDFGRRQNLVENLSIVTSRNNQRLPDFHRLDLGLSYQIKHKNPKYHSQLVFSVYNAYNRKNPYLLDYSTNSNGDGKYQIETRSRAIFAFIPGISYTKKW